MKNFFVLLLVLSFGKLAVAGVDISGEYGFYEWSNFSENSGRNSDNRFLLEASFREGDSLMAHISLITIGNEVDSIGDDIITNEIYGVWNFADAFEFKFGQFTTDWANGSVFSANAGEDKPSSFESVSLAYDAGMVKVTYLELDRNARQAEEPTKAIAVDFMSLPPVAKTAHLFYVTEGDLTKYGAVLGGDMNVATYELTYASDKNNAVSSDMMNLEVGVNVLGIGQVVATYHKDKAGYDPLSYDLSNAGPMDVHKWGEGRALSDTGDSDVDGLTYYTIGYIHNLNDSNTAGVMYHDFSATESGDKLGTEIDVYASHKYNDVLTASVRYGKYDPETKTEEVEGYSQWVVGISLNF